MPNALAHYGVHGVASDLLFRRPDPKWVFLGSILPDVPWIMRRAVRGLAPGADLCDVAVLATGQASLAGSLLLAGGLAALSKAPRRVFGILGFNALLHLLLDTIEIKWGGGVHLFAPLRWDYWQLGLCWPESWPVLALTLFGLGYTLFVRRRLWARPEPGLVRPRRFGPALLLLAAYFAIPALWMAGAEASDAHSVKAMRHPEAGARVVLDRNHLRKDPDGVFLDTWSRRSFEAEGAVLDHSAKVSVRGELLGPDRVRIREIHEHEGPERDLPSYVGLGLLAVAWLASLRPTAFPPAG